MQQPLFVFFPAILFAAMVFAAIPILAKSVASTFSPTALSPALPQLPSNCPSPSLFAPSFQPPCNFKTTPPNCFLGVLGVLLDF